MYFRCPIVCLIGSRIHTHSHWETRGEFRESIVCMSGNGTETMACPAEPRTLGRPANEQTPSLQCIKAMLVLTVVVVKQFIFKLQCTQWLVADHHHQDVHLSRPFVNPPLTHHWPTEWEIMFNICAHEICSLVCVLLLLHCTYYTDCSGAHLDLLPF